MDIYGVQATESDHRNADISIPVPLPEALVKVSPEEQMREHLLRKIWHAGPQVINQFGKPKELIDFILNNKSVVTLSNYLKPLSIEQRYFLLRAFNRISPLLHKLKYTTFTCCPSTPATVVFNGRLITIPETHAEHRSDGTISIHTAGLDNVNVTKTFGFKTYINKRENIDLLYECNALEWTLIHEVGHALETNIQEWMQLMSWDGISVYRGNYQSLPSPYAESNAREDYAESFALYILKPTLLKDLSSERYNIMHARFSEAHAQPEITETKIELAKKTTQEQIMTVLAYIYAGYDRVEKKRKESALKAYVEKAINPHKQVSQVTFYREQ